MNMPDLHFFRHFALTNTFHSFYTFFYFPNLVSFPSRSFVIINQYFRILVKK